jgi:hemerythrin superfamily protein
MNPQHQTPRDVISFLKGQHEVIEGLFESVIRAEGSERARYFAELKELIAAHEEAEEEVVHPTAQRVLPNGRAEVAARETEEAEAKKTLAALAGLAVDSSDFDAKIRKLQKAVRAHARSEEREEFDKLASKLDDAELKRMRTSVQVVEAQATATVPLQGRH